MLSACGIRVCNYSTTVLLVRFIYWVKLFQVLIRWDTSTAHRLVLPIYTLQWLYPVLARNYIWQSTCVSVVAHTCQKEVIVTTTRCNSVFTGEFTRKDISDMGYTPNNFWSVISKTVISRIHVAHNVQSIILLMQIILCF